MFQRTLRNKSLPCLSNYFRLGYVNKFSSTTKAGDSTPPATENLTEESSKNDDFEIPKNAEDLSRLLDEAATYSDAKDQSWRTTPYPKDAPIETKPTKPMIDPKDTSILLFPGQGTLKVGKVEKYLRFPNAKELFEIANEILGYDLLKLCLHGPQHKLDETQYNQPATVVSSLVALERVREERPAVFETCVAAAGYSVGEISALIFSGALTVEDGIRLVAVRGAAMQRAAEKTRQGMMSVFCTPTAKLHEACEAAKQWALNMGVETPVCTTAIYLYTQGKILAGNEEALRFIEQNSSKYGLTKLNRLPVSGAFHTALMEPAVKSVFKILSEIDVHTPRCRVYSNCTTKPFKELRLMKKYILKQITTPVKWEQIIQSLYKRPEGTDFPRTVDVGSEGRMRAIVKLINAKASQNSIVV